MADPSIGEFQQLLERLLETAKECYEQKSTAAQRELLGEPLATKVAALADQHHAARGAALTLCVYKALKPSQDIRYHQADHPNGFSARKYDSSVTVKVLLRESLKYSVESHWLTRKLAEGPFLPDTQLRTVPKLAGPLLIEVVNEIEERGDPEAAEAAVVLILVRLMEIRARDKVPLTRPKHLTIEAIESLLEAHFARKYEKNAPRLPQLALYAAYQCLAGSVDRYRERQLDQLLRMKAADRKAGTVGDVVVSDEGTPFEGAEVKLGMEIEVDHVTVAIEKLRAASVQRYYVLSTVGVKEEDEAEIEELCETFRDSNGCELIVDGLVPTIGHFLRVLKHATDFVLAYTLLVEEDEDLSYEHRVAWNEICAQAGAGAV